MYTNGLLTVALVSLCILLLVTVDSFCTIARTALKPNNVVIGTNKSPLFSASEDGGQGKKITNGKFLEEASRSGYDNIKSMSIEERTRRAMLAEAAEDRVVILSDELELLLCDDGMPKSEDDREEVIILAKQIKASREQYKRLVNGDNCSSLDMFESSSSDTGDDNDTLDLQ
jgi:hypothetical protein